MKFLRLITAAFAVALIGIVVTGPVPVNGQVNSPCTASMLTSFTPCMNFVTNSSQNGTISPTADCCNALKSLTSGGTDCLCQIVTGSMPFQIPINQSVAVSLPRACKMSGVPLQCKAPSTSIPPPGPTALAPTVPTITPPSPPQGSTVPVNVSPPPEADTTPDTIPTTTTGTNSGNRPFLTPSAAVPAFAHSPYLLLLPLLGYLHYSSSR